MPFKPQQQPIVELGQVVDAGAVDEQGGGQPGQLERIADSVAIAVSADVLRDEPVAGLGWTGDAAVAGYDAAAAARIAGYGPQLGGPEVASPLAGRHGSGTATSETSWW